MPQAASDPAENPLAQCAPGPAAGNVLVLPGRCQPPASDLPAQAAAAHAMAPRNLRPLGQNLLEDGAIDSGLLLKATVLRKRENVRLGEILLAHGWVSEAALTRALSRQWRTNTVDLVATPPDPRLIDLAGADFCLHHAVVPWRRTGGVTWIATARPEAFAELAASLPGAFGAPRMLLCSEVQAQEAILATRRTSLIRRAELRVPAEESCRTRNEGRIGRIAVMTIALAALAFAVVPVLTLSLLAGWTVLTLFTAALLKALCLRAAVAEAGEVARAQAALAAGTAVPPEMTGPLPLISVMVPLFAESDIADKLVGRLARLRYPRELTDILLVVEEGDSITRAALADAGLPRWIRVVTVPDGPIRTKPRALNYALNFCRGQIIGVWDAEDRPEPDQLHKVARRFHFAPDDVACLQGKLDFYNPRTNWLARCFTVEYATWFRAILPGVARMGLVVPLGGTTLFFRRNLLERVGAWDAWNVTEDADLGVRLARRGYRTEIIDTTTDEEANCRALPWIKQRSRWLKGYAMTWGVHMRDPRALWADLGPRRFVAFQVQFLGTLSQYLLAPVLLSFWLITLGLPHPLAAPLAGLWSGHAFTALFALFIAAEALNIAASLWACRGAKHRHLMAWVPTLHVYHPLGCLAGWKAIYEVVVKPFYWDKTTHGVFDAGLLDDPGAAGTPASTPAPGAPVIPLENTVSIPLLGQLHDSRAVPAPRPRMTAGRGDTARASLDQAGSSGPAAAPPAPTIALRTATRIAALQPGAALPNAVATPEGPASIPAVAPSASSPVSELGRAGLAQPDLAGSGPISTGPAAPGLPRHLQLSYMRRRRQAG